MFTLADIRKEYNRLDQKFGVDTSNIKLSFSTRYINTYGQTQILTDINGSIPKSVTIAAFLRTEEEQFYDTIRHEYAHVLATIKYNKDVGHDYRWERLARECGCKPNRASGENCDSRMKILASRKTYTVKCLNCNGQYVYLKMSSTVKSIMNNEKRFKCGSCGGDNLVIE